MTYVGTTPRKAMSKTRRLRIFEAHAGRCVLCRRPIDGVREAWTVEHIRALGLGGKDEDANCGPAHETCRREKDKTDVAAIAKAKRTKARHIGIKAASRPIQSRGFAKSPKPRHERPSLPPRQMFAQREASE